MRWMGVMCSRVGWRLVFRCVKSPGNLLAGGRSAVPRPVSCRRFDHCEWVFMQSLASAAPALLADIRAHWTSWEGSMPTCLATFVATLRPRLRAPCSGRLSCSPLSAAWARSTRSVEARGCCTCSCRTCCRRLWPREPFAWRLCAVSGPMTCTECREWTLTFLQSL